MGRESDVVIPPSLRCPIEHQYSPGKQSQLRRDFSHIRREAAILTLLRWSNDRSEWDILLTQRSDAVSSHKGEVAFPGGMRDAEDLSPSHTALREAFEEVGLPQDAAKVVGVSFPFVTRHNILVFPVLAILTDSTYQPQNNAEVDLSFWLPLKRFLSNSGRSVRSIRVHGRVFSTNIFLDEVEEVGETVVTYGLTSYIAVVLACLVYQRKPDFRFPIDSEKESSGWLETLEMIPKEMMAYVRSSISRSRL